MPRCQNQKCRGETVTGVRLGKADADGKIVRGTVLPVLLTHGFVVRGALMCGPCAGQKP